MIETVSEVIGIIGLFFTAIFSAYGRGYEDAKKKYDTGIVRYDLAERKRDESRTV